MKFLFVRCMGVANEMEVKLTDKNHFVEQWME